MNNINHGNETMAHREGKARIASWLGRLGASLVLVEHWLCDVVACFRHGPGSVTIAAEYDLICPKCEKPITFKVRNLRKFYYDGSVKCGRCKSTVQFVDASG